MISPELRRRLRNINARKLCGALERDGFVCTQGSTSHRIYRKGTRRVSVAFHHPGATFPRKTLENMLEDIGWTDKDLIRLKLVKGVRRKQ